MEWLLQNAKAWTEVILFFGAVGGAAAWGWRVLLQSKKSVDVLIASINDIKKQLITNGGGSLFDVVSATSKNVTALSSDIQRLKAWQWSFSQASKMPMWESDAVGNCTRVNVAMTELTGRSLEQMTGSGWENILPTGPERAEVWTAWADAISRARDFEHMYTVHNTHTGQKYRVKAVGSPIIADGKLVGMLGRFQEIVAL